LGLSGRGYERRIAMLRTAGIIALYMCVGTAVCPHVRADQALRLADVLTDHIVLQRGKDVTCWGWAEPGSKVEVLLTQSRDEAAAFAGEDSLKRPEGVRRSKEPHPAIGNVRVAYIEDGPADFGAVTRSVTTGEDGRWEASLGEAYGKLHASVSCRAFG
jgi:hypothetical protein